MTQRLSLAVWLVAGVAVTAACGASSPGIDPALARLRLSEPEWKIVPNSEGAVGETELQLSAIVHNPSDQPLIVGLSFRSYHADGSLYTGCFDDGQGNAGLTEIVQAGSRARVICRVATPPSGRDVVKVHVKRDSAAPAMTRAALTKVREGGFELRDVVLEDNPAAANSPSYRWSATGRIHSDLDHDLTALVRFHFYDRDNVQVGRCQSRPTLILREVEVRVTCIQAPWIPPGVVPIKLRTDIMMVP